MNSLSTTWLTRSIAIAVTAVIAVLSPLPLTQASAAPSAPSAPSASSLTDDCSPTLYVVDFTGKVRTASTATNKAFGKPIDIGKTPGSIVLTPNQKTAYVTNNGGGVSVIDLATKTATAMVDDPNLPTGIAINADGSKVYVANTKPAGITVIDTATNTPTTTMLPSVGGGYGIAVSADGKTLYLSAYSSSDENLYVINAATMAITGTIPTGSKNKGITMSPNGDQLWISGNSTNTVHVLSTATNTMVANLAVGKMPERVEFSPDGTTAWVTNLGGKSVTVMSVANLSVLATYAAGAFPFDVAFNAAGTQAYVTNSVGGPGTVSPGTVTVLDVATGAKVDTISGFAVPDNIILGPDSCGAHPIADKAAENFPFCSWWLKTTPQTMNVAFPDGAAVYWTTPFIADPELAYTVKGTFPQSRYFSITVYDQSFNYFTGPAGNVSGIADYNIQPDKAGTNPWQTAGASTGGTWQVHVTAPGKGVNTLPMMPATPIASPSQPFSFITMRVYVPKGTSPQTAPDSVTLPSIVQTNVRTGASQTLTPCSTPALSKVVAVSKDAAKAKQVLDNMQSGHSTYVEPCSTSVTGCPDPFTFILPTPCVTGSVFPNPSNAYLTALFTPQTGKVVVVTGKAPTSPAAVGEGTPGDAIGATPVPWNTNGGPAGYQVRYWSLANNLYESPYPIIMRGRGDSATYSSLSDFQATLDDGRYQAVVSATKPRNLHGASWLPTAETKPGVAENIIIRNMLPAADFAQAIQNIATSADAAAYPCDGSLPPANSPYNNASAAKSVMGDYYPAMWQCDSAVFEKGGVEACAKQFAEVNLCKTQTGQAKASCVAAKLRSSGITRQPGSMAAALAKFRESHGGLNLGSLLNSGVLAKFSGAGGLNLFGVDGRRGNFAGANLMGTSARGALLDGARLNGANGAFGAFDGGRFLGANLSGASLSGASARGADFNGAVLSQLRGQNADFAGASLANAQATGAQFQGASLTKVNAAGANLSGASMQTSDLSGASLTGANLNGASLQNANLSGADLSGATTTGANASGATFDNTTMPDGSVCSGSACAAQLPTSSPAPAAAPTSAPSTAPTSAPSVSAPTGR